MITILNIQDRTQRGDRGGGAIASLRKLYLRFLECINYSSDIWDFFRHIDLTAPLVKNPAYGPVNILEHASGTVIFSQIS